MNTPRLQQLVESYANGACTREELRELQTLLRADAASRRFFRRYLSVDMALRDMSIAGPLLESDPLGARSHPGEPGLAPRWWQTPPALALAAALALLIGLAGFWLGPRPDSAAPASQQLRAPQGVAVLTQSVNAQWTGEGRSWEVGAALPAGKLSLKSGLLQIEFFSGAIVVLEGPAEFQLVSATRGFCSKGKLRSSVPPQAQGFTIGTPGMDVVDLGTEFALSVDEKGSGQVHVIEGEIQLHSGGVNAAKPGQSFFAGQGALFAPSTAVTPAVADPSSFVGRAELIDLAKGRSDQRSKEWREYSQKVRARPETVAYYAFDQTEPWSRTLRNESAQRTPGLEGAIIGCEWTRGRWAGKSALEFKRTSDRVRVHVPGEFDSLSFTSWVRIEGWDRWLSSLLLTDGFGKGATHWQISDKGELILGVNAGRVENHFSPPVISAADLGRWVHLATVYDAAAKNVSHYLDGKRVSTTPILQPTSLKIGNAELGNWKSGGPEKGNNIRSLNGRMDEMVIVSRALTPEEILESYEKGKPRG
jgi:hypothetical protein